MFADPEEVRHSSDLAFATAGNHNGPDHSINVVIRVRPVITESNRESAKQSKSSASSKDSRDDCTDPSSTAITFPAAGQIQVEDTIASTVRPFAFNVVFEPEATQEEVFEHSGVKRLVDMALDGFACTIFAYGQTSTGKTYTLTGNVFQTEQERAELVVSPMKRSHNLHHHYNHQNQNFSYNSHNNNHKQALTKAKVHDNRQHQQQQHQDQQSANLDASLPKNIGIVQLSFAYLFEQIKRRKLRDKTLYVITVSYLEVYNEQVLDLLNPSPRSLNVRWAKDRGFYAENLFKVECEDIGDLEGVLEEGCKNRQVRSHSMNENSSRSHAVMTITLSSEMPDPEDPQGFIRKEGRFCLVDLAGSEKTKRTNSKGGTFIEANNINRSLLVLGNCIACLADPKRRNGHIPYRDSTLTKLLADSLAGNGMTLMIACVSPKRCDSQETINTLRYASRAKRVRMNPVVQMDPRELLILSLKREVRVLRMENGYLRQNYHHILANSQQAAATATDENGTIGPTESANVLSTLSKLTTVDHRSPIKLAAGDSKNGSGDDSRRQLLSKYMHDNEVLRVENVQLNLQRHRLIRDHELVCKENERLLRKLNSLHGRAKVSDSRSGSVHQKQRTSSSSSSNGLHLAPILSSSASSPSLLSLVSPDNIDAQPPPPAAPPDVEDSLENEISNGLILIKEKGSGGDYWRNPDDDEQPQHQHYSNGVSKVSRAIEESADQQSAMLDLTIRGKSAVNGGGGGGSGNHRVLSNAKRRN